MAVQARPGPPGKARAARRGRAWIGMELQARLATAGPGWWGQASPGKANGRGCFGIPFHLGEDDAADI